MYRLFLINVSVNTGSHGRIVEQIGNIAAADGWDVWIAHGPRYINRSSHHTYQVCSSFEEKIHAIESRFFDNHGLSCTKATKKLVSFIKEVNPDIIHLHNIHGYYLNYKILFEYLKECGKPIVWTMHDCWPMTGHCVYFELVGCEKWKTECYGCPQLDGYPVSLFFDNSRRNFRLKKSVFTSIPNLHIVTVSEWLRGLFQQSFFSTSIMNPTIQTIYNGIDLTVFSTCDESIRNSVRAGLGLKDEFVGIALATKWLKYKGWEDYLKLAMFLPKDMRIILVGVNDEEKKQLPNNIIGISMLASQNDLAKLYSSSDVLLNLSYQETFGLTTVEGYACKLPAIVYNSTASPELVKESTGIIVEPGDIMGVLCAMKKIRDLGRSFFADSCRTFAESSFNSDIQNKIYLQLYKNLLPTNCSIHTIDALS